VVSLAAKSSAALEDGASHNFLGVFPTAAILNLTLGVAIRPWPFILNSVVFNACMVGLLTWLVMR